MKLDEKHTLEIDRQKGQPIKLVTDDEGSPV